MSSQRFLVMGDNHGNSESLRRVVDETEDEEFDFVVHVGDLTNTYFDGLQSGVGQLEEIEPYLDSLEERSQGGLLYIWGNRDHTRGPDRKFVYEEYDLGPGNHIPEDELITIANQTFTQDPSLVGENDILVTHGEYVALYDHFQGRAYFSGHVHTGRYKGRCLNSAFLYRTDDHGAEAFLGGYFIVTVEDDHSFDVEFHNIGRLKKIICPKHHERGVLFAPEFHNCQFCYDNQLQLYKEMALSAHYGLTKGTDVSSVPEADLVDYALSLFEEAPSDFESQFTDYLNNLGQHPMDPLKRDENRNLVG